MNYAMQRDDYLRQQFRGDINHYHTNTLIFVDETGTDRTDTVRKFGYSLRGALYNHKNYSSEVNTSQLLLLSQ